MAHTAPPAQKRARAGRPPTLAAPRERILEEAAKLFAHSGYDGSSVADLAAALGVSKAAIYHYFTTKQDIYDAIILAVLEGLTRHVGQALDQAASPAERLRAFMLGHARYFERHHAEFVTMLIGYSGMALPEREDAARLRDGYEAPARSDRARRGRGRVPAAGRGGHRPRGAVHAELDGALVQTRHGR